MVAKSEKDIGRDSKVYRLELYVRESKGIKINGIGFDSSDSDIENAFKNIPIYYSDENEKIGYRASESGNVFDIYRKRGEILTITVIKGGK